MNIAALFLAVAAVLGLSQVTLSAWLVGRFARKAARAPAPCDLPPVTVLKPLHGDEPMLEAALASYCAQDYPVFQVVFGVRSVNDPAYAVAARVAARFPGRDIAIVCDATPHGSSGKVANLINMMPEAKHDVLLVADSDMHAAPDFLRRLAASLAIPGTGLVTTLYAGLPPRPSLASRLGAMQITQIFLPGALLSRVIGRQDCLGATMLLSREVLTRIGGFTALANCLADDNVLGQKVQALGLAVRLAFAVPATTVAETGFGALWRHELRWARTVRSLVPAAFGFSALQYPLAFAALALILVPGQMSLGAFLMAWLWRAAAAAFVSFALKPVLGKFAFRPALWLLPLRDWVSIAVMLVSYTGRRVEWRGHAMHADRLASEGLPS